MSAAPLAADELERLRALREAGILDSPPEQAFDDLTRLATVVCDAPIALVSLVDAERQWFKSAVGLELRETLRDVSFCAHAIRGRDLFVINDARLDERFRDNPLVTGEPNIRFYAGAPLLDAQGHGLGTLCVLDRRPRELAPAQAEALTALARQVMRLMELRYQTAALETQQTFTNAIIDTSSSLVAVLDRQGRIVRCNRACEQLSGFAFSEARGRYFWELLLDGKSRQAMQAAFADLKPELFPNAFENEWVTRSGERRRIAWNNSVIPDGQGAVQYVVCVGIDVTERRRAERDRDRMFELAPDFMCTMGPQREYSRVNPAFGAFLGIGPEALVGQQADQFIHPDDRGRAERVTQVAARQEVTECELRFRRHDGAYRWLSWSISRLSADGFLFACARDVTERKEVERLKDDFVSTVSHELRTPLTAIRGALGLLEGGVAGELPQEAQELVQLGRSNCERLVRLINDILDLEKIEAGKIDLDIRPIEVGPVIQRTIDDLRPIADAAQVKLSSEVGEATEILADEDRVLQVLVNLVSNAIKFSPAGGRVVIRTARSMPGRLRFTVIDEGPGIPPEKRGLLFKRFSQVDSSDSRKKGGTGLGLAICRAIVERQGGDIGVDALAQGSAFWFEVPTAPRLSGLLRELEPIVSGARLLVVEDDSALAQTVQDLLQEEGYIVDCAGTLAAARRALANHRYSALIQDVHLPDGDGLSFMDELRSSSDYSTTPVLIMSGQKAPARFSQPVLIDWLMKPFDEEALRSALAKAVPQAARPTILIVDDDNGFRQVVSASLRTMGVECVEASDGVQALDAARLHRPDLIVLDVELPHLDGFNVVETLRAEGNRSTPLIIYTGRDLSAAERRELTLGATRHLVKARATEEEFVGIVRSLLAGTAANGEGQAP